MTTRIIRNRDGDIARYGLNAVMEFDHVIQVWYDGTVTDAPTDTRASWAPELNDGRLDGDGWSLLSGYTGQQGGGDILHNSESIGSTLERDILATPGFYVAIVANWSPDDDEEDTDDYDGVEGWAVAYRESLDS